MGRWQVSGSALHTAMTGRKALVCLSYSPGTVGMFIVVTQSSLPPCKEGIAISNFRNENTKEFYD